MTAETAPRYQTPHLTINSVKGLVGLWPSAEVFSDDLGLKYRSHGRLMGLRGSIPRIHWDAVVLAASRRGIDGVTHGLLERLHAGKRMRPVAAEQAVA